MFAASKTASVSGGYQISRSLRFNSADSAYLNRTPASNGNRKTWTYSAWIKRSTLGTNQWLFGARGGASPYFLIGYNQGTDNNIIRIVGDTISPTDLRTSQVFRDVGAWFHLVVAVDTSQATASNRIKIYVNGTQVTAFSQSDYPAQNNDTNVNATVIHNISGQNTYGEYFDGYMTEVNFIDGQALTPSSFGETNAQTGVWQPKAYSGSYGTNGFYLNFSDNSNTTAATLGKDYSGNGNNWTPNNFSVTAGAGNDSLVDSPTSYGTDTGVGGTVRGNYCTLNPISTAGGTFTNGNLDWASPTTDGRFCISTIPVNFMNCYCEVTIGSATSLQQVGVYGNPTTFNPRVQYRSDGQASIDGVAQATYASFTTNDIIGIAYNSSTGSTSFYKNGTLQGSMTATSATVTQYFAAGSNSSGAAANYTFNFGQRPFAYTAPSGYKALCTQNLPVPTIGATTATQAGKYFNTVIYNGANQTPQNITTVGFQPDFVWIKWRANTYYHNLFDVIRGVNNVLSTNVANAEGTRAGTLTAFNSDGFSLGNDSTYSGVNIDATSYVAWNWKANGSGSTNTAGSITSTVSASTTSGFSVVTYTGTGANATVGHGLGSAVKMLITKRRDAASPWVCGHTGLTSWAYAMSLNGTGAQYSAAGDWNSTAPTSTVFSLGNDVDVNTSGGTYVAYCFAEVAGYSKAFSYTANGSTDGPFVYLGFRPAFILLKGATVTGAWWLIDCKRSTYNLVDKLLFANLSNAEDTYGSVDLLSNGFKIRNNNSDDNTGTYTYIGMAFAEFPFKYSLAR